VRGRIAGRQARPRTGGNGITQPTLCPTGPGRDGRQLHVVCDNYAIHKPPAVRALLAKHPTYLQGLRLRQQENQSSTRHYLTHDRKAANVAVQLESIDGLRQMQVDVSGPGSANRLLIIVGTATFLLTPPGSETLVADNLVFDIGPVLFPGQFREAVATASLASISNQGTAVNALWAVDSVLADFNAATRRVRINARLVVRDSDGFLNRIGFQVNILAAL
jgi:hypothetical protein